MMLAEKAVGSEEAWEAEAEEGAEERAHARRGHGAARAQVSSVCPYE